MLNARPRKARRLWPTKSSARGRIDKILMVSLLLFRGPSLLASAVPHVNLKLRLSEGSAADSRPCAFELEGHAYELGALAFNVAKDDGRDGGRQRRLACLHTDRQTASTFGSAHGAFAPRPTGKPIHITIRAERVGLEGREGGERGQARQGERSRKSCGNHLFPS